MFLPANILNPSEKLFWIHPRFESQRSERFCHDKKVSSN